MDEQRQRLIFERWSADHVAIIERTVRGFSRSDADADDLRQELWLALWRAVPAFRDDARSSTFVYRVAHNAALSWHRRHSNRPTEPLVAPETVVDRPRDDGRVHRLIERHVRDLPPIDRSLLMLSLDGLSYRDIAAIHGGTANSVGVRLHRLRTRLLETVREEIDEPR